MEHPHHRDILIYTYNSFRDPLFYGTVLVYLKAINADRRYRFHIISYEQPEYTISAAEAHTLDEELNRYGIIRYPLQWSSGSWKLLKKANDLYKGYKLVKRLKKQYGSRAIFALANIAGAFSYLMARRLRLKTILFTYEPHSEFMVECGVWSKNSLQYRLLHYLERKMGVNADYIATGTVHMVERLQQWHTKARVYRVPSCIDTRLFRFDPEARESIRKQLGSTHKTVFVYVGKFGDLYYKEEIAVLCRGLRTHFPDVFFLVLTPQPESEIRALFARQGITSSDELFIGRCTLEEVPAYLSAGDMGIVAVPPLPSQRFRSPIKVGEYLSCGLPYLVCRGVSEDDMYADQYRVGVVLEKFSETEVQKNHPQIAALLSENKELLRSRCRETGIAYRDQQIAIDAFTEIFSEIYPQ